MMEIFNLNKVHNNLINELSPYLLQHAYNPVDWHPWNEETLKKAKDQNKPIFLSIGYSACHWCHVMEHESFDDAEVARMMNDTFINIKVDREERPDIDHIYMTVCQVMNGNGGWPLTVLLTPNLKPFFSGTYFPKESMPNRVGIKDVIKRTQEVWANHYNEILESADEITEQIKFDRNPGNLNEINEMLVKKCFYELAGTFDNAWGGFTKRPKFPIPHYYYFLFKFFKQYQNQESKDMALFTLRKMRMGGLYDHIGKGFHRYSTDQEWLLPHFEKMLYDQALLTIAYTEAYQVSKDDFYAETATDILEYVTKNLLSPEGGFYSAEDADSEGVEGKFYVWEINEIRKNLIGDVEFFTDIFNFKEKGNYVEEATGQYTGKNIPFLNQDYADLANKYNLSIDEFKNKVNELRLKLNSIRENRVHPQKDDKILTDWNGMMIAAYAIAGRVFNNDAFTDIAKKAYDFIKNNMKTADGILLHRYRNGKSGINGMIDDYAFVIKGLIELFQTTSDQYYLNEAEELFNIAYNELFDEKKGAFFFASKNADDLIIRKKELYDGATPSGNSVMIDNMIRLSTLTNIPEINEIIKKTLRAFEVSIAAVPSAYSYSISTIMTYLNGTSEIIISGNNEQEKQEIFNKLNEMYLADIMIINLKNDIEYSPRFSNYKDNEIPLKIYHCKNFTCEAPVYSYEELIKKM